MSAPTPTKRRPWSLTGPKETYRAKPSSSTPSNCGSEPLHLTIFQMLNEQDEYDHDNPKLIYTEANVPGPGANVENFDSVFTAGCDCMDGECDVNSSCVCISKQGANYSGGQLLPSKFNGPVLECGSACSCSTLVCKNRMVQHGPRRGLFTFEAQNGKGIGLKTSIAIPAQCFICEYAGEIIDLDEAKRRAAHDSINYILVLKEHYEGDKVLETFVDPKTIGNIGRYVNHSCNPNTAIVPVRFNNPVPRLALFSKRLIEIGEEITFDYGDGEVSDSDGAVVGKECFCGEGNCRRFLPFNQDLL